MCKVSKWVLSLGIMAVTPGLAVSGPLLPLSFSKGNDGGSPASANPDGADAPSAAKSSNQQVAEQIAAALRQARLDGYNIQIEYQEGVATLMGQVRDVKEKAKATEVTAGVEGVNRVDNQLVPVSRPTPRSGAETPEPIRPVKKTDADGSKPWLLKRTNASAESIEPQPAPIPATAASKAEPRRNNQKMAEEIAAALSSAKLSGYDIEIRYRNGTALLTGSVANRKQWQKASQAASSVPGVQNVQNRMRVRGAGAARSSVPYRRSSSAFPTALQPAPNQPPMPPQGQQAPGQGPPMGPSGGGMPMPPSYGHPGQGASHTVYNMPNVPENAWPSYASYPNYAQVAYPKQYSASAWPYIGPFYPYPQVPMGWRQAQLEWDDGYWNLNFKPRTSRWWWFMNPENW